MQNYKTLRQSLLGELAMSRKKERGGERRERKNAIYSGHLRLCQQPRTAHALRSDQHKESKSNILYIQYCQCAVCQVRQIVSQPGLSWLPGIIEERLDMNQDVQMNPELHKT